MMDLEHEMKDTNWARLLAYVTCCFRTNTSRRRTGF
jgi:hypothetical protein